MHTHLYPVTAIFFDFFQFVGEVDACLFYRDIHHQITGVGLVLDKVVTTVRIDNGIALFFVLAKIMLAAGADVFDIGSVNDTAVMVMSDKDLIKNPKDIGRQFFFVGLG